jgi:3-dehydroquinate dehydratase type I
MICISIIPKNTEETIKDLMEAEKLADLVEIRLDHQTNLDKKYLISVIKKILEKKTKPIILTLRSKKEGGFFPNDFNLQIEILIEGCKLGADYIDIELDMPSKTYKKIQKNKNNTKIISSYHNFEKTLSPFALRHIARRMNSTHSDIFKIACKANKSTDNLAMLDLIDVVKRRYKKDVISICMGEKGLISRVVQENMNGFITFCALKEEEQSAPGQITVQELKNIRKQLNI